LQNDVYQLHLVGGWHFLTFLAQELTEKVIKMTEDQLFAIIALTLAFYEGHSLAKLTRFWLVLTPGLHS
jgi:hypothetical protein